MKNQKTNLFCSFEQLVNSVLAIFIFLFLFSGCSPDSDNIKGLEDLKIADLKSSTEYDSWEDQIAKLEQKMRRFHNFQVAQAQGWDVDGSGYVPGMGHHYINMDIMDDKFELLKPEALLYIPDENGDWEFLAVEYLVFGTGPEGPAPEGFIGDEDVWFYNPDVGAWTLHAWIVKENPDGVFAAFNSDIP